MNLSVTRFEPADLDQLVANALGQRELAWHDRRRLAGRFGGEGVQGFTVRAPEGRVLFCGGISEFHPQYARMWAVYAEEISLRSWGFLLNRTRQFLAGLPHRRVDTLVDAGEPAALRWAEACGLERETVLTAAAPHGGDMVVMARIEQ